MKRTGTWPERPEAVGWYEVIVDFNVRLAAWWGNGTDWGKSPDTDDVNEYAIDCGTPWRLIEAADQTAPHPVPLCKDCRWCEYADHNWRPTGCYLDMPGWLFEKNHHWCHCPHIVADVVEGRNTSKACTKTRETVCGYEGRFFEAKEDDQ